MAFGKGGRGPAGPAGPPGSAGAAGAAGTAGAPGATGAVGVTWRGAWSSATAYAARDAVLFAGSSYVALNAVSAGGTNPRVDTANWVQIAQGGGEIAYAEATAAINLAVAATLTDIAGLSIGIPAGTGPYVVELWIPTLQVAFTAGATAASNCGVRSLLVDEGAIQLAHSLWKAKAQAASATDQTPGVWVKRKMPATASAKTIKAQWYLSTITNVTNATIFAGPGTSTGAPGLDLGPMFIRAEAV